MKIDLIDIKPVEPSMFALMCELGLRVELHDALAADDAKRVREMIEEQIREIKGET